MRIDMRARRLIYGIVHTKLVHSFLESLPALLPAPPSIGMAFSDPDCWQSPVIFFLTYLGVQFITQT